MSVLSGVNVKPEIVEYFYHCGRVQETFVIAHVMDRFLTDCELLVGSAGGQGIFSDTPKAVNSISDSTKV